MAWYKHGNLLHLSQSNEYDKVYASNTNVPHDGIYRCETCGWEYPCRTGATFAQRTDSHNHGHQWPMYRLVVFAERKATPAT